MGKRKTVDTAMSGWGTSATSTDVRCTAACGGKADMSRHRRMTESDPNRSSTTSIRGMVRFLRRHGCSQGQALTLGGVAETFVALNRGPRVEPMDIWSG